MTARRRWARRRIASGERGAAIVEFALILPVLVALTFGIVEFSAAFHDSSVASDAARAGGRVGSALGSSTSMQSSVVRAVDAALQTLPDDAPQELWIYKANDRGFPGTSNDFSSCASSCVKYTWDEAQQGFDMASPQGGGWPASTHQVCHEPFDQLGVFVKVDHEFVTGLFGTNVTLTDHSVFRFEPAPTSACV